MPLHVTYWLKTALYGAVPGGFGYMRQLRAERRRDFDLVRDRHPVREKHNSQSGWQPDMTITRRTYRDYQEYVTHQQQKYHEILHMYGGFSNRTIVEWRQRFYRRFRHVTTLLPCDARILCLGARQGTEVEVWRDLGFRNAYGIDLNPGPNNLYVHPGDFMHLTEADASIDCLYTNSVDHVFDLELFMTEQVRVLKPTGYALYDLPRYSGSRSPGAFEAIGWQSEADIINCLATHYQQLVMTATERKWQWVLFQGPKRGG